MEGVRFESNPGSEPTLKGLLREMGYEGDAEAASLREDVLEAVKNNSDQVPELIGQYQDRTQEIADEHYSTEARSRAVIAMLIDRGFLYRDAGFIEEGAEELREAWRMANNLKMKDLLDVIDEEIRWMKFRGEVKRKPDYTVMADELDKLQEVENNGRGISFLKSVVSLLRQGDFESARRQATLDQDKIWDMPHIVDWLNSQGLGRDSDKEE